VSTGSGRRMMARKARWTLRLPTRSLRYARPGAVPVKRSLRGPAYSSDPLGLSYRDSEYRPSCKVALAIRRDFEHCFNCFLVPCSIHLGLVVESPMISLSNGQQQPPRERFSSTRQLV
jgi:hypothetical protein